jgi:hypothetical protein
MRCNRIFQPAPSTSAADIGFVSPRPASHSPRWRLPDSPEIGFVSSTPQAIASLALTFSNWLRLGNRCLPAQLASFRTTCGTDLPVCQPPAGKPALRAGGPLHAIGVKDRGAGFQPATPTFLSARGAKMSKLQGQASRSVARPFLLELASFRPGSSRHIAFVIFGSESLNREACHEL